MEENFKQAMSGILTDVQAVSSTFGVDKEVAAQLIIIYELVCMHEHMEEKKKRFWIF